MGLLFAPIFLSDVDGWATAGASLLCSVALVATLPSLAGVELAGTGDIRFTSSSGELGPEVVNVKILNIVINYRIRSLKYLSQIGWNFNSKANESYCIFNIGIGHENRTTVICLIRAPGTLARSDLIDSGKS